MSVPQKLFLVDGSNQAFRAFFAIQGDMRAPDGFPTKALFGFINMLKKLQRVHSPDYLCVVFDKGLSFRNDIYPEYKGQRPDMPEDLRTQWPEFIPFCLEWGVHALAQEGFEADDIIGTLASRYASEVVHVSIVSSDKDFAQLVGAHISLYDVRNEALLGPEQVVEKWGVAPDKIIDLLALMGDKSDNVPGVPGVGPKKAAGFIHRFGSADEVVARAAEIGGKTGQRVAESADLVALSRRLVTIVTDMELDLTLENLRPGAPDLEALEARLARYNFRRMLVAVREERGTGAASRLDRSAYRTISTAAELDDLVNRLRRARRFAYDSETTSLDPLEAEIVGMSFCDAAGPAVYVPIAHAEGQNCPGALEALLPILLDPSLEKIGQNLKFDLSVLLARGHDLRGIAGDTMLADYLLDVDRKHGLDALALRHLDHNMLSYKETTKDVDGEFRRLAVDVATAYAAEDAHVTWLVAQEQELGTLESLYRDIELPLIRVLAEMELEGIGLDTDALLGLSERLGVREVELQAQIQEEAGEAFNVNSTQQLARILFDQRGLRPIKKTKSGFSTDADTLTRLAAGGDPLCAMILAYREVAKLKNTYVDKLPLHVGVDGRIHSSFHQAVTATGRLSSNEPNLQNIPIRTEEGRRIRACFVARPGHLFLSADYSQIELRLLAHFCEKGPLVDAYHNQEDIHRRTAAEVFGVMPALVTPGQRRAAKAINFGIAYGMSAFRLSNELNIPRKEAQTYIDGYFVRYPQVRAYMDRAVEQAREHGYVETLYGRRRPVPGIHRKNFTERKAAERIAINTPIQGSAADLIKVAMLRVADRLAILDCGAKMILQVHDELVFEVPESAIEVVRAAVVEEMEGAAELRVPLMVETGTGRTWDAAH